jgi:hypothetical protein
MWLYTTTPSYAFMAGNFTFYTKSVGLLGRGISPSQGLYLHAEQHKHRINEDIHASSGIRTQDPSVRAGETVHALDRAEAVIGWVVDKSNLTRIL